MSGVFGSDELAGEERWNFETRESFLELRYCFYILCEDNGEKSCINVY